MNDETLQELAALHAFDLLAEPERTQLEARMTRDPELRRWVDELRSTAALSALASPPRECPPELRAKVLASVATRAPSSTVPPTPEPLPPPALRFPPWLGWSSLAAAAALALAAANVWLGQTRALSRATLAETELSLVSAELRGLRQQLEAERLLAAAQTQAWRVATQEADTLRGEVEENRDAYLARIASLQADRRLAELRIASLRSLAAQAPQASAIAIWDPALQRGLLRVSGLPALTPDHDYQLWVIDPQYPRPLDGGVFAVDPATGEARFLFRAELPVKEATQFAISLERKGGVPVAEGPMVLAGN